MFSPEDPDPSLSTLLLTVSLAAAKLPTPIIASGGIMNGQGIKDATRAGAQAVQMGTAFLLCPEAGTSPAYRQALIRDKDTQTTELTRVFSGRYARGIQNRFMAEMNRDPSAILPFPAQNALTRDIRKEAAKQSKSDLLSLWAGTGLPRIRQEPAGKLVQILTQELRDSE